VEAAGRRARPGLGEGPGYAASPSPAAAVRGAERGPGCARLLIAAKHARSRVRERSRAGWGDGVPALVCSGPTRC
jgi:hypothetical protein